MFTLKRIDGIWYVADSAKESLEEAILALS